MKESESVLRVGEDKNNVTILNSKISTAFRKKKSRQCNENERSIRRISIA